jgi:hypothetical protein
VAPAAGVIIRSHEIAGRIDVPDDSPDTERHIKGLKDLILYHVPVLLPRHHVGIKPNNCAAIGSRAAVH